MEFGVLGRLEVRHAGRELSLGGARQRRLMAMFLLNQGRPIPLERLEEDLWFDPPPTAHQQVHNAIAALRRVLRVDRASIEIRTTDAGYLAAFDPGRLDLDRHRALVDQARAAEAEERIGDAIDRLSEADGLWRGPALAGTHSPYLDRMAARLEDERIDAAQRRFALRLSSEDSEAVVGELRSLVVEHPFRDLLRGLLMLALFRSGRTVEALDSYEEGRRLLARELGIDPSLQLRRIHRSILQDQDAGELLGVGRLPVGDPKLVQPRRLRSGSAHGRAKEDPKTGA